MILRRDLLLDDGVKSPYELLVSLEGLVKIIYDFRVEGKFDYSLLDQLEYGPLFARVRGTGI